MIAKTRRESSAAPVAASAATRWKRPAIEVALVLLTWLAYSNSFGAGFTLDNHGILRDPRVQHATAQNIRLMFDHSYWWPNGEAGLYRPLTTLTYLFNYAILGDANDPGGYHWVNLILHSLNVLLVFALLLRLTVETRMAALIAAAWAVHPVLTESVTNIVGRADLLAGAGTLGGLLLYLHGAAAAGGKRVAWMIGLMAVTFAGVFSKESAVCIIGLIVAYEVIRPDTRAAEGSAIGKRSALTMGLIATAVPIAVMLTQRTRVLAASLPAEYPFTDQSDLRRERLDRAIDGAKSDRALLMAVAVARETFQRLLVPGDSPISCHIRRRARCACYPARGFIDRGPLPAESIALFLFGLRGDHVLPHVEPCDADWDDHGRTLFILALDRRNWVPRACSC